MILPSNFKKLPRIFKIQHIFNSSFLMVYNICGNGLALSLVRFFSLLPFPAAIIKAFIPLSQIFQDKIPMIYLLHPVEFSELSWLNLYLSSLCLTKTFYFLEDIFVIYYSDLGDAYLFLCFYLFEYTYII
jgi:hypothetical protein